MLDVLRALGHYNSKLDASLTAPASRAAIKSFQSIMGLTVDGVIGKKETAPALNKFRKALTSKSAKDAGFDFGVSQCCPWRFTYYYIAEEDDDYIGTTVPVYNASGKKIFDVSPRFYAQAALEGSGQISGSIALINVDAVIAPPKGPAEYAQVLSIAKANGWVPSKPGYAGLKLNAAGTVVGVRSFRIVPRDQIGEGYGMIKGRAHVPLRTVATDIGAFGTSDPKYKKTGGVIPRGTLCFVPDLVDRPLPVESYRNIDGWGHDGQLLAVDSGGGVEFAQCDLFCGVKRIANQFHVPSRMHLWYKGIEARIPFGYGSDRR